MTQSPTIRAANGHLEEQLTFPSKNGRGLEADGAPDITAQKVIIESAVEEILRQLGEDPQRDGLLKTPHRVAKAYFELLEGYQQNLDTILNGALFEIEYQQTEPILVANIPYQSMCEHHMLPFSGKVHVAYLPSDKVLGLSKVPRIVDMYARRLQIQERLTNEIADALEQAVGARGVMVMLSGEHSCAALRGVKKHGVNMVTTARRGVFLTDASLKQDFYAMVAQAAPK